MSVYVFGTSNHALGENLPNQHLTTPNSLLGTVKRQYILLALLHSLDGRMNRGQRLVLLESGDVVLLLPWLIAYRRRGDTRHRDVAQ